MPRSNTSEKADSDTGADAAVLAAQGTPLAETLPAAGASIADEVGDAPVYPHPSEVDVSGKPVIIEHEDGRRFEVSRGAFTALYKPNGFKIVKTSDLEDTSEE